MRTRTDCVSVVIATLVTTAWAAPVWSVPGDFEAIVAQAPETPAERRSEGDAPSTRNQLLELQSILLAYADQYMSVLAEACDIVEQSVPTSDARSKAHSFKFVAAMAGLSIATGPNPEAALLDMVTMVTLERMVAEEPGWQPDFGDHKKVLIEALRKLERDIWVIAARYLTRAQLRELRSLIEQWRVENPRMTYVTYIRLNDFAGMRAESALLEAYESGLLLDMSDALRTVDQTRLMARRFSATWIGRRPRSPSSSSRPAAAWSMPMCCSARCRRRLSTASALPRRSHR